MVRGVWPLNWLRNGCPGRISFPTPCEAELEGVGELRVVVELEPKGVVELYIALNWLIAGAITLILYASQI